MVRGQFIPANLRPALIQFEFYELQRLIPTAGINRGRDLQDGEFIAARLHNHTIVLQL